MELSTLQLATTQKNITIVTNSAHIFNLDIPREIKVIMTGGELTIPKWSMWGQHALNTVQHIHANKCILGCSGLSHELGLTTMSRNEMSVNSLMLTSAEERIIVCDSSKIGHNSSYVFGSLSQIDILVTDHKADPEELRNLKRNGTKRNIKAS